MVFSSVSAIVQIRSVYLLLVFSFLSFLFSFCIVICVFNSYRLIFSHQKILIKQKWLIFNTIFNLFSLEEVENQPKFTSGAAVLFMRSNELKRIPRIADAQYPFSIAFLDEGRSGEV